MSIAGGQNMATERLELALPTLVCEAVSPSPATGFTCDS